jgi:hypothetical protein
VRAALLELRDEESQWWGLERPRDELLKLHRQPHQSRSHGGDWLVVLNPCCGCWRSLMPGGAENSRADDWERLGPWTRFPLYPRFLELLLAKSGLFCFFVRFLVTLASSLKMRNTPFVFRSMDGRVGIKSSLFIPCCETLVS